MSDFKAKFAAAKAQRKNAAPTREQLKALRAQKAAAAAAAAAAAPPPRPATVAAAVPDTKRQPNASAFEAAAVKRMPPPPPRQPRGTSPASSGSLPLSHEHRGSSGATATSSGLPAGFFDGGGAATSGAASPSASPSRIHGPRDIPLNEVDVGPAADLPPGFFDAVRNGTSPRAASSSDSGGLPGHGHGHVSGRAAADTAASGPHRPGAVAPPARPSVPTAATAPQAAPSQPEPEVQQPGALPKDFFADKEAGAKASGVPAPKKLTPEEQIAEFNKAVAGDVLAAEEAEEVEAEEFAAERAAREAFEQQQRMAAVEALKQKAAEAAARKRKAEQSQVSGAAPATNGAGGGAAAGPAAGAEVPLAERRPAKKARSALDVFEDSGSSSESEDSDEAALDWRAKAL